VSSEFGSKAWRRLSDALGVKDQKAASNRLSTDPIVPVVALDIGMQGYNLISISSSVALAVPTLQLQWQMVGDNSISNPAGLAPLIGPTKDVEILIMGWSLTVTAAGAGLGGDLQYLNLSRIVGINTLPIGTYDMSLKRHGYLNVAASQGSVKFASGPNQVFANAVQSSANFPVPMWLPAKSSMLLQVECDTITNFAVNTQITTQAWGVTCPIGARPPFL